MDSRPLMIFVLTYLVIALIAAAGFGVIIHMVRNDQADHETKRHLEQTLSNFEENMGLNDSGVAVLMGLVWPFLIYSIITRNRG